MAEPGLEYGSFSFKLHPLEISDVRRERPSPRLPDMQIRKPGAQMGETRGPFLPRRVGDWEMQGPGARACTEGTPFSGVCSEVTKTVPGGGAG